MHVALDGRFSSARVRRTLWVPSDDDDDANDDKTRATTLILGLHTHTSSQLERGVKCKLLHVSPPYPHTFFQRSAMIGPDCAHTTSIFHEVFFVARACVLCCAVACATCCCCALTMTSALRCFFSLLKSLSVLPWQRQRRHFCETKRARSGMSNVKRLHRRRPSGLQRFMNK